MNDAGLVKRFDQAMLDIYARAKGEANYTANVFLRMVKKDGGWLTAKSLINAPKQSDGFTALYLAGRLDLTVEALVVENPEWHALFTSDELAKAKRRLSLNGYTPKQAN